MLFPVIILNYTAFLIYGLRQIPIFSVVGSTGLSFTMTLLNLTSKT